MTYDNVITNPVLGFSAEEQGFLDGLYRNDDRTDEFSGKDAKAYRKGYEEGTKETPIMQQSEIKQE